MSIFRNVIHITTIISLSLSYPIYKCFPCEGSGSVNRLPIILRTPRSRVDVNVAGGENSLNIIQLKNHHHLHKNHHH